MNIEQAAKAFLEMSKDWDRDALRKAYKELPEEVQRAYSKLKKASFFVPENAGDSREVLSPSGKFKLVITSFTTGSGSWNYTQGSVYRIDSDEPIAVVQRNYSRFPHLFVEGHPNGHSYFVCGEDYQGQTVIELDTGRRRELLPEEAKKGHGFCWSSYEYVPAMQALLVDGCFWACPYEYRFYDFSDPMNGWPQIGEDVRIDEDQRKPELLADGTVKVYQTEYTDDDDDEEDETKKKGLPPVAAYTVYRREGLNFVPIEDWVSEEEKRRRIQRDENERKYEECMARFRAEDPLYLAYLEHLKDPAWASKSDYEGIGVTYPKWCPDFESNEQRMCRRIMNGPEVGKGPTPAAPPRLLRPLEALLALRVLLRDEADHLGEPLVAHEGLDRVIGLLELLVREDRVDRLVTVAADGLRGPAPAALRDHVVIRRVVVRSRADRTGVGLLSWKHVVGVQP